jgi:hypothetical protein|tara:strand:+ start:2057 stop:3370 length:1314 start_codon:yes stop_codon:yes gene_type:complete
MLHYPRGQMIQHPIVEEPEYIDQQQRCSMLVDVASQMAKDWQNGYPGGTEEPGNKNDVSWSPTFRSTCDVDSQPSEPAKTVYGALWTNFTPISPVIWTVYSPYSGFGAPNRGPACFIATEKGKPHTAYLIFRGTLTPSDLLIDLKYFHVNNPISGGEGKCHKGFSEYFTGLGINSTPGNEAGARPHGMPVAGQTETLYEALHKLPALGIKHLIVTGHSLGSSVATLVTAWATTLVDSNDDQLFETIRGSVSASPRVGDAGFKKWFDAQRDRSGYKLGQRFWRLTNESDGVPKVPGEIQDPGAVTYAEVGYNVHFNANYPDTYPLDALVTNTVYKIVKVGDTNWDSIGFSGSIKLNKTFTYNGVTVIPGEDPGKVQPNAKWQANPNHNPCCCYSYAINNPLLTFNKHLNAGNESQGGSCHFPVVPARTSSSGDDPPAS